MIHEPPPFFHRGPSPLARLTFFALLAIATMIADHRFGALEAVRLSLSVLVAPLQSLAAAPGAAMSRVTRADSREGSSASGSSQTLRSRSRMASSRRSGSPMR